MLISIYNRMASRSGRGQKINTQAGEFAASREATRGDSPGMRAGKRRRRHFHRKNNFMFEIVKYHLFRLTFQMAKRVS